MLGLGFRGSGIEFSVQDFWSRVQGSGLREAPPQFLCLVLSPLHVLHAPYSQARAAPGVRCGVWDLWFGASCLRFCVWGWEFRVQAVGAALSVEESMPLSEIPRFLKPG